MDLLRVVDSYRLSSTIRANTYNQLRHAARHFTRWCDAYGHAVSLDDDTVNRYLLWMESEGRSPHTIRSRRGALLTIWRAAGERGIVTELPGKIRGARPRYDNPEAWDAAETWALAEAAKSLTGTMWGLPRGRYLRAFVLCKWDTSYRLGDMLKLEWTDLRDGVFWIDQSKTSDFAPRPLWPETLKALDAIRRPVRDVVFPCRDQRRWYNEFSALVKAAGVRHGTSKWIRRASGTAAEKLHPGGGMRQLGHRTPGLAWKHYLDRSQLVTPEPLVPPLDPRHRPRE